METTAYPHIHNSKHVTMLQALKGAMYGTIFDVTGLW